MKDGRNMLWKRYFTLNIGILFFVVGWGGWGGGGETMLSMALCERYSDLLTRNMISNMHGDEKMLYSTFLNRYI